jgi:hypothetical protein
VKIEMKYYQRFFLFYVITFIILTAVLALLWLGPKFLYGVTDQTSTPVPNITPTTTVNVHTKVRYGFNKNTMGWDYQTVSGNRAIFNVKQSSGPTESSQGSLQAQVELIGKSEQESKGETFVNLFTNPPDGENAPLDLEGKLITMRINVPSAAIGDGNSFNGIQVFVKDVEDRSQYGKWVNLGADNTDRWIDVSLRPLPEDEIDPDVIYTSPGFDPSKIYLVGLKIGSGKDFDGEFKGFVWIDEVSWP